MAIREVIFRGKRTDNGEWVEGDLLHYESGEMAICKGFSKYGYEATEIIGRQKVIPETVGQYTGLTDKNGMKIFEGDILTIENEGVYAAIKYNESNAAFYVEDEDHEDYLGEAWETDVVIIGNIHDDPEILKGGGENG